MLFNIVYLAIDLDQGFPMTRIDLEGAVSTQTDPRHKNIKYIY